MTIPFRFIHGADLHIDSPFKGLRAVPDQVKESLLQATFLAFQRLVDLAIKEQVAFITISGDLFDESDRSLKAQLFLLKQFERLYAVHIDVFIVHGNHDYVGEGIKPFCYPSNVHIFSSEHVQTMPAYDRNGEVLAYIHGISYATRHVRENLALKYEPASDQAFHIGLYHGSVGNYSDHDPYAPCHIGDLLEKDYHYWALGHIHKRQVIHEQPPIVYAGNTQGRHRNESGDKGCYVVQVNGLNDVALTFHSLASVRWEQIFIDISEYQSEIQFMNALQDHFQHLSQSMDNSNILLSVTLTGSGYVHEWLSQEDQKEQLLEHIESWLEQDHSKYWIYLYDLVDETNRTYDEQLLLKEEGFESDLLLCFADLTRNKDRLHEVYEEATTSILQQPAMRKYIRKYFQPSEEQLLEMMTRAKRHVLEEIIRKGSREEK